MQIEDEDDLSKCKKLLIYEMRFVYYQILEDWLDSLLPLSIFTQKLQTRDWRIRSVTLITPKY